MKNDLVSNFRLSADIGELIDLDISITQYLYLKFVERQTTPSLYNKYRERFGDFDQNEIDNLVLRGYLVYDHEKATKHELYKYSLGDEYYYDFAGAGGVDVWIKTWFELWPRGIKTGGYYVKADLKGCERKMKRFVSEHPEYSEDDIFQATINYIDSMAMNGWGYMKTAPYFIYKDGLSTLAGECEALSNVEEASKVKEEMYGYDEL